MAPIDDLLSVFEGESRRIVWLPPLTLGYIYTISGYALDFWLAVGAIAGARYFYDIFKEAEDVENPDGGMDEEGMDNIIDIIWESFTLPLLLFIIVYLIALIFSVLRLNAVFTHRKPVLVGLAGFYWGILIIVLLNIYDTIRN